MDIEQRIAHLERSNRHLRIGLVILTIAITTVLIVGQAKPEKVPDVIQAKQFQVVNDKGQKLVRLGAPRGEGGITTYNDKGQALVTLSVMPNGDGAITTLNGKGQNLVALAATADGKGLVNTFNGKGQRLVMLGGLEDGVSGVVTFDGDGRITGRIGNK